MVSEVLDALQLAWLSTQSRYLVSFPWFGVGLLLKLRRTSSQMLHSGMMLSVTACNRGKTAKLDKPPPPATECAQMCRRVCSCVLPC